MIAPRQVCYVGTRTFRRHRTQTLACASSWLDRTLTKRLLRQQPKHQTGPRRRAASERDQPCLPRTPRLHACLSSLANVRIQSHLTGCHWRRSDRVCAIKNHSIPETYKLCTKRAQSSGPENIGPERPFSGHLALWPVLSLFRITLEYNEKIRPQPDRENAFARASGGGDGTHVEPSFVDAARFARNF